MPLFTPNCKGLRKLGINLTVTFAGSSSETVYSEGVVTAVPQCCRHHNFWLPVFGLSLVQFVD